MKTKEERAAREDVYLHKVGEAIKAAMPTLDETDQQIASAVYRLMSGVGQSNPPQSPTRSAASPWIR